MKNIKIWKWVPPSPCGILTVIAILLLVGCTTVQPTEVKTVDKLVYVTNPLPLPSKPDLPNWTGKDMSCLSEEMKQKIRDRDRMRKEYSEQLEAVIKSTHEK